VAAGDEGRRRRGSPRRPSASPGPSRGGFRAGSDRPRTRTGACPARRPPHSRSSGRSRRPSPSRARPRPWGRTGRRSACRAAPSPGSWPVPHRPPWRPLALASDVAEERVAVAGDGLVPPLVVAPHQRAAQRRKEPVGGVDLLQVADD
jgi:hypothetical protein